MYGHIQTDLKMRSFARTYTLKVNIGLDMFEEYSMVNVYRS